MEDRNDYWNSVEAIAEEILAEHYGDDNAIQEQVTERVDSSSWIIYTASQLTVLAATKNEPDGGEVAAMSDGSWQGMQTVAAFLAMEADVYGVIEENKNDADTTCPDCERHGVIACSKCKDYEDKDEECPKCNGVGDIDCPRCNGTGEINPFNEEE